eukprot:1137399-Pelagomonas_calceolata.AAC.1
MWAPANAVLLVTACLAQGTVHCVGRIYQGTWGLTVSNRVSGVSRQPFAECSSNLTHLFTSLVWPGYRHLFASAK